MYIYIDFNLVVEVINSEIPYFVFSGIILFLIELLSSGEKKVLYFEKWKIIQMGTIIFILVSAIGYLIRSLTLTS